MYLTLEANIYSRRKYYCTPNKFWLTVELLIFRYYNCNTGLFSIDCYIVIAFIFAIAKVVALNLCISFIYIEKDCLLKFFSRFSNFILKNVFYYKASFCIAPCLVIPLSTIAISIFRRLISIKSAIKKRGKASKYQKK